MPIKSGKRPLMPANARNADVASKLIDSIMPIQQQKIHAAFRVQGFQGILYHRLQCGRKCTCKSGETQLMKLSDDGKASNGAINRLLSGDEFAVLPYATQPNVDSDTFYGIETSPNAPSNKYQGSFIVDTKGPANQANNIVDSDGNGSEGNDGAPDLDIDALINGFDAGSLGFNDAACPICFGSGFVGGYEAYRTFRHVVVPTEMQFDGELKFQVDPWLIEANVEVSFELVLPRGTTTVDSFKTFSSRKVVASTKQIDGVTIKDVTDVLRFCDGRKHVVTFKSEHEVSHFEIQMGLTSEPPWFEFARRNKSSDVSLLDNTEPFAIQLSPEIPFVNVQDVIVESTQGKYLFVQTASPWETRKRALLSPEVNVRVIQPQELFKILPLRGRVFAVQTTNSVNPVIHKRYSGASDES